MMKKTTLYEQHIAAGGKMVNFAGWQMPIHYGSQVNEHLAVRANMGIFDVSHMCILDITGNDADTFLRIAFANDVARLDAKGKALYTCMLNEHAGILDDLIVYYLDKNYYRCVVNAATAEKDVAWLQQLKAKGHYSVKIEMRADLSILALQGPQARTTVAQYLSDPYATIIKQLKPFHGQQQDQWFIARTGYTGEDGLEIILPNEHVIAFWQGLVDDMAVQPCGLGARDTLRLEAGLNLYGHDMDETTTPLESNLAWTVAWQPEGRAFVGREFLEKQHNAKGYNQLIGLVLMTKGVLRDKQQIRLQNNGEGIITSGSFSPCLQRGIAMARIPYVNEEEKVNYTMEVAMRGRWLPVRKVAMPFVRHGKILIDIGDEI